MVAGKLGETSSTNCLIRSASNSLSCAGRHPQIAEDLIANLRDPAAIREHLTRLQRLGVAQSDPPLAIGTAKELIESTAKTVLQERGLNVNDRDDLPTLINRAQEALGLHPRSAHPGPDSTEAVKRILGGLMSIAAGLGELRNRGYGTGHGPKGERAGLRPRHARLAVNAAVTWCSVMLDTLADDEAPWRTDSGLSTVLISPAPCLAHAVPHKVVPFTRQSGPARPVAPGILFGCPVLAS